MWLARLKAANQARIMATQFRSLGFSTRSLKFISKEEAKSVSEVPVGNQYGAVDDPIYHTHTRPVVFEGDHNQEWWYRTRPDYKLKADVYMTNFLGTVFWFWVFYNIYWRSELIVGHWYVPYIKEEFSDEELGIPPDDAEDPEYWGNHGKKYGTYR